MLSRPDAALARLLEEQSRRTDNPRDRLRVMFGKVTTTATGNLRVQPDSMATGDIGPLWKNSAYTPVVNDRVLCLWDPDGRAWVVCFKVVNQP